MHCRCNLVFCYKCGGVLKKTAKSNNLAVCTCGKEREAEMRIHEAAPNHNLQPAGQQAAQQRRRGANHGDPRAMLAAAMAAGMHLPPHIRDRLPAHLAAIVQRVMDGGSDDDDDED